MGAAVEIGARDRLLLWRLTLCASGFVLCALIGCVVSDTDDLEGRKCAADSDCTLPGYRCETGYCLRLADLCREDDDCEDGLYCNGIASCDPSSSLADDTGCVAGAAPPTNDGIVCTVDTCDEAMRRVVHVRTEDCICADPNDHAACEALARALDRVCQSARCNAELTCILSDCQ